MSPAPGSRASAGADGEHDLAPVVTPLQALALAARVKECAGPDCSLLFLDASQARRRRWCSMERCGNLAKVAGYRSRSRAASTR